MILNPTPRNGSRVQRDWAQDVAQARDLNAFPDSGNRNVGKRGSLHGDLRLRSSSCLQRDGSTSLKPRARCPAARCASADACPTAPASTISRPAQCIRAAMRTTFKDRHERTVGARPKYMLVHLYFVVTLARCLAQPSPSPPSPWILEEFWNCGSNSNLPDFDCASGVR